MVICLERVANDLHEVQPMSMPPRHLLIKIQKGLPFWYQITQVILEQRPLWVCVVVKWLSSTSTDRRQVDNLSPNH